MDDEGDEVSKASSRAYLRRIADQIRSVPRQAAIEVAVRAYIGLVESTVVDSGQAVLNWRIQPYVGSMSYAEQEILWGFGTTSPVSPAGYKWSGGVNEHVRMNAIEGAFAAALRMRGEQFDGISVYNPIEPGFAAFQPGNDQYYFSNALGEAEGLLGAIVQRALEEGEEAVARAYTFVEAR